MKSLNQHLMISKEKKLISISLNRNLANHLDKISENSGLTKSEIVELLLVRFINEAIKETQKKEGN